MMNKSFIYTFFIFLFLGACATSKSSFENDYTYLYNAKESLIKPDFKIFHHHKDSSTLFFQISTSDILYSNADGDTSTNSKILIKYKLRSFDNKSEILDSATYPIKDYGLNNADELIQSQLKIACPSGNFYNLEIRLRDEYKDLNVVHYIIVDKRANYNEQFFLVKKGNKVLCANTATESRMVLIEKSSLINNNHFLIQTRNEVYKKAFPPFAMARLNEKIFNAESTDSIQFKNHRLELLLEDQVTRLVPILNEEKEVSDFYIRYYYNGFPEVNQLEQMIEPIRYISTTNEYNTIIEATDKRKAIEAFWLQLARDENAAKALIREYYSRIEIANKNFSSIKPGWKTDRGIIFIVYGKPYKVEKYFNKEIWLYGEDNNILSVKFEFNRIQTDWSKNDFELIRDANYKNNWYRAVDVWRQGRIN